MERLGSASRNGSAADVIGENKTLSGPDAAPDQASPKQPLLRDRSRFAKQVSARIDIWMYAAELAAATAWLRCARPGAWARLRERHPAALAPYLSSAQAIGLYAGVRNRVIANRQLSDPIRTQVSPGSDPFLKTRAVRPELVIARLPFTLRGLAKLAATLKWDGFLAEAAILYRLLIQARESRAIGLTGLGDIYLTQAGWAEELRYYRDTGTWLDPEAALSSRRYKDLIPRDSVTAYLKATRCFHMSARYMKTSAPGSANLARALMEAGIGLPTFHGGRQSQDAEADSGPLAAFRGSLVRNWSKSTAAANETGLDAVGSRFRSIALLETPRPRRTDQGERQTARSRFLNNRFVAAEIISLEQVCGRLGAEFRQTHPSESFEYRYRCVFDGRGRDRLVSYNLASAGIARLPHATDLGYGFLLVDDRYLIRDSKHVPWQQVRIFCPWLWALEGGMAIIELSHDRLEIGPRSLPSIPIVGPDNYYHWLIETAGNCAAWEGIEETLAADTITYGRLEKFQRDILDTVLPERKYDAVLPAYPRQYRLQNVLASSHLARDQSAHPKVTAFLRRKFEVRDEPSGRPTKLYLTRGSSTRASMMNEPEVRALLDHYGFKQVDTATLSVAEQRALFANCEMIAAPGGAALSNILFCPVTAKVLVFGSETGSFETFSSLAATVGCKSWLCVGQTIEMIPHALFVWTQHRFKVDLTDLKICLDEMHAA